mgnify:CR=1 FL=1
MTEIITVKTTVAAPIEEVWRAYVTPADIKQWNAASDDWHTTASTVDLRVGGKFSSRMEAKDGSFGFDFAAQIFLGRVLTQVDDREDYGEVRIKAIGEVDGIVLVVIYTDRDDVRWIISARKANRKERALWLA